MECEFKYETAFRRTQNYLYELGVDNILDKTQKTHNQEKKKNFIKIKHSWLLKSPVRKYIGRAQTGEKCK